MNESDDQLRSAMQTFCDQNGRSLDALSHDGPVLVVFLRHQGCIFCREAAAEVADRRAAIEGCGTKLVLVHMSDEAQGEAFLDRYALGEVPRISDPQCQLYEAFGLGRGSVRQLLGPKALKRGFRAGVVMGHGLGMPVGDVRQMPGAFLVHRGRVVRAFRPDSVADRPDYAELAVLPVEGESQP